MALLTSPSLKPHDVQFIGDSPAMAALRQDIATAARTSAKVMILGETGVGKEVVARLLHQQSSRRGRAFVAVNCSGVPETLLESELFGHARGSFTGAYRDRPGLVRQADRGTLFLDELGEMSLRMQAVLLRFTETGEVQQVGADGPAARADVRLVTATHRDLSKQIAAGAFREDLYYRLNVIQICIPPLRDRGDDILQLVDFYVRMAAVTHGLRVPSFTPDALQVLLGYGWPGNVRELRNIAERLVLQDRSRPLTPDDLPAEVRSLGTVNLSLPLPAAAEPTARGMAATSPSPHVSAAIEPLWTRLRGGEDFWTVVHQAFKARQLTRGDLATLIDRGLNETRGSYRALLKLFNMPPEDYKRFHSFLYQQRCNLPVAAYRHGRPSPRADIRHKFSAAS